MDKKMLFLENAAAVKHLLREQGNSASLVNDGNTLLFPVGTRNRTNQILLSFKYGAVYMAQVTGAPIIPIIINSTNRRRYEVKIGKSMSIKYLDDLSDKKKNLKSIKK